MTGRLALTFLIAAWQFLGCIPGAAQDRCSTVAYEQMRHPPGSKRESAQQFEQWMQSRLSKLKLNTFSAPSTESTAAATYTIPVVVHVIHNGPSDPSYISQAQVLSQIDVLNKDFKRMNADAVNTPAQFLSAAGSLDIEFVLAKQNPEGLPTNGITYTQGTKTQWSLADQSEFKALSYWAAENYLNIWVIKFSTSDIGFAQLPVSNTLPGLEEASNDRLTDGIVVDYRAFGSTDAGAFPLYPRFSKGRTATHEIGHFLGLRHIWGDNSGCATDYVSDTPSQSSATTFCPTHPQASSCPEGPKMFMNFMDYTDDPCMNMLTWGQVNRMVVVLSESPRRASLTVSPGANDPVPVANDLGIRSIISPGTSSCRNPIVPQIEVRNYGSNAVSSAQIQLSINGTPTETITFPLTLASNQITTLSFSSLNFSAGSTQQVAFQILQTNGGADGNSPNNQLTVSASVPAMTSLPIIEPFDASPAFWTISNPDGQITWTNRVAPDNTPTNRAMAMDFYNYQNEGSFDWLVTPSFVISNVPNSQLRFDVAYAQYPGQTGDELKIYALPDCSTNLSQALLLYNKSGSALSTVPTTSNLFVPSNATQWRKPEILTLSSLSTATAWQLAFVTKNGYGNNLYLDNVVITENEVTDIVLSGIASPGIVHCNSMPAISFYVSNNGSTPIISFAVDYAITGGPSGSKQFSNILLGVGEQKAFSLDPVSLPSGPHQIILTVSNPNGIPDIPTNNTFAFNTTVDKSFDSPPLRMTFDNPLETPWVVASPSNAQNWESIATSKELSITYRSFSNSNLGDESWLVSPVMDLSKSIFSLFFEVSYAQKIPADDRLRIVASKDCGVTFNQVIMDRPASSFSKASSSTEWFPGTNADWKKEYLSLEALAGEKNIRVAFVAHNNNGNNIFIDNIELFAGDDPNPPTTSVPYQLYYSDRNSNADVAITFNLQKKQDVRVQIYTMQGAVIRDMVLPATLNQTYYYDLSAQTPGIYVFRLQFDDQLSTSKVFIRH